MSNSTYGPSVPSGQYSPYATVTPYDHTAWILTASAVGLVICLSFAGLRVFIRRTISPVFGWDDWSLAGSYIFGVAQIGLVLAAASEGLGLSFERIPDNRQDYVQKTFYVSGLCFYLSVGLSKLCVVCFLHRLSSSKYHQAVFWISGGIIVAWSIAATLAVALQCDISRPWISVGTDCSGLKIRHNIIGAFDIVIECGIVGIAVCLVWGLQTGWPNKAMVILAFAFRLLMIVPITFRLATFDNEGFTTNPTLLEACYIVWTETEMCYSIISATIPNLRSVMRSFETDFGRINPTESDYGVGSTLKSRSTKKSVELQLSSLDRVKPNGDETVQPALSRQIPHLCGPNVRRAETRVSSGFESQQNNDYHAGDEGSIDSAESRANIIKKNMTWVVTAENR